MESVIHMPGFIPVIRKVTIKGIIINSRRRPPEEEVIFDDPHDSNGHPLVGEEGEFEPPDKPD